MEGIEILLQYGGRAIADISKYFKIFEKCTNFYFGTEKNTLELQKIYQYCEKILGTLASKSFFSVKFGVAALPSLLPYRYSLWLSNNINNTYIEINIVLLLRNWKKIWH